MYVPGNGEGQRPLRICLATALFPPTIGGEERIADLLASGMTREGHNVTVVTQGVSGAAASETRTGVEIRRTIRPISRGPLFGPTYCLSLARFLAGARGRFDIVQASYLYWDAVAAAWLKAIHGARVVVRLVVAGRGGDLDRFTGMRFWPFTARHDRATLERLVRFVVRRADAFVVLNPAGTDELAVHGVSRSRCHVIPNGVEVATFGTRTALRPAAIPWRVVCVGRLTPQKGQDVLLAALPRVAETVGPVRLTLVGDGPDRERLRAVALEAGLAEMVEFAGVLGDVRPALEETDLFVLPSRFEGHALALLEAMATGRPIVATAVPGNTDAIRHDEDGILVPPDDPAALAVAMSSLLADRGRAARLAASAQARAREHFSAEVMVGRTIAAYRRTLERAD
jgi:glycosyltransferase involved in cell wall biosynthesis